MLCTACLDGLTILQDGSGAEVHTAQVLPGAAGVLTGVLALEQQVLRLKISIQNAPARTAHVLQLLSEQPWPQPCRNTAHGLLYS